MLWLFVIIVIDKTLVDKFNALIIKALLNMVFSNMGKNFTNTVKSRPPLVVFTICLMGIIVTTFSLAYYIHNYEKPILNNDAKDDWLTLLKHFNAYDICIENASGRTFRKTDHEAQNVVSTTTMAKISKIQFDQEVNIEGLVPLQGWSSRCPEKIEQTTTHLHIAFTLPKKETNGTKNNEICVTLTGPDSFMPKLVKHSSCSPPQQDNVKKWGKLTTKLSSAEQADFCEGGSIGKLEYDIDFSRNLKWDMFLTAEDRVIISYHLIITSLVLLIICILITCYALFKARTSNSGGDSKQSLMSKGMYL